MASVPSSVLTTAGLIGGYSAARAFDRRLGGAVLAACGAAAFASWRRSAGLPAAAALSAVYTGAFGLSHPLSKKMGAWPSVLAVTAATGVTAHMVADRRRGR